MEITHEIFLKDLLISFPLLKDEISEDNYDLVYHCMARFAEYTNVQIGNDNKSELIKCFNFLESRIEDFESNLLNAFAIDYYQPLFWGRYSSKMKEIVNLMPPKLMAACKEIENM